jgi:hypothetical protein
VSWTPVLIASFGCLALKVFGAFIPARFVGGDRTQIFISFLPVALLSSLIVSSTIAKAHPYSTDARSLGVAAAALALWRKLSFLPVLIIATSVAAVAHIWWR